MTLPTTRLDDTFHSALIGVAIACAIGFGATGHTFSVKRDDAAAAFGQVASIARAGASQLPHLVTLLIVAL